MSKFPEGNNGFSMMLGSGLALAVGVGYGVWATGDRSAQMSTLQEWDATERAQRSAAQHETTAPAARPQELEAALADLRAEVQDKDWTRLADASGAQVQTAPASTMQDAASSSALGLGRPALPEEVAAWNVDILPDGRGLPEGSGDVFTGEEVFGEYCASCHGDFAEGRGAWPVLAGGFDTLADRDPVKTVGSYWPYLSTVWDYVHRSMPFGNAGTLTDDEVYAITAYILYSNDLVDDDFTLSRDTFMDVEMPNADGFIVDDRPETEYPEWRTEPCMSDCKDGAPEITRRATDVGVTPADDGSMVQSVMEERLAALGGKEWGAEVVAGSVYMIEGAAPAEMEEAATESPDPQMATAAAAGLTDEPDDTGETASAAPAPDPALVAEGEKVFRKCKACHAVGDGAKNRVGPHLNDVVGRTIGGLDDFRYSSVFKDAAAEGRVWDAESLSAYLANPKAYLKGTKMAFAGLKQDADIDAVVAYLRSVGE